jgi:hypothetical protein
MEASMRLGVMLPLTDIGGEPGVVRDFAQAAEEIGYTNLGLPDHVLGVNVASRPDWGDRNTSADLFHDPFLAFAFLAGLCRATTEFSTQVLILAQRQAVRGQAGGKPRRAVRRALSPRRWRGLEPDRVHRPQRELFQPRSAVW